VSRLTIYLADLRYNYLKYVSSDAMPLGIGYMKAVMSQRFPNAVIKLFAYPDKLEEQIKQEPPNVIMFTNYTWNEALSLHFAKHIKKINPNVLVVLGGPNIPIEDERKIDFLKKHPYVDIYALGEGDFYASELVEKFVANGLSVKALLKEEIHSSVYKKETNYFVTPILARTKDIDNIPSPWLSGIMDEFFDGLLVPLFETNRGCPLNVRFVCKERSGTLKFITSR
jgi:radical SAM superfamily enzyme YgiQ (UPF0313 family)